MPSNPERDRQEAQSDSEEETKDVAGLTAGSTDLKGVAVHARRKLSISGNVPPKMLSRTWIRRVHAGVKGAAPQRFLPTNVEGDEKVVSMCDSRGAMILQGNVELPEPIARECHRSSKPAASDECTGDIRAEESSEQEKCKVTRPHGKLVVEARGIYKRKMKGGEVKYICRLVALGFWQVQGIHYSPTPATV